MRANVRLADRRRAGRIDSNQVWRDTVEVVGDIRVPRGTTLTIAPGTVVLIGPDQRRAGVDAARTELLIFGTLLVSGGQRGVLLTSAAAVPAPGDWYGVRVAFGTLQLNRMDLEFATIALSGEIDGAGEAGSFDNVTISKSSGHGIDLEVHGTVELNTVVTVDAGGIGMRFTGDGKVNLTECTITGSASHGLAREAGSLDCSRCGFSSNGISSADAANLFLLNGERATITSSSFFGGMGARLERAGAALFEGNQFSDHDTALSSRDTRLQVTGNSMVDCALAFEFSGLGAPVLLALNSIEGSPRLVENRSSFAVSAGQNWWGQTDESRIEQGMNGLVEWRPALNFDPRSPVGFALKQNFPNPFNSSTVIDYTVGISQTQAAAEMTLEIRDTAGGLVRRLVQGPAVPGVYSTIWSGTDSGGRAVASGTYFYLLEVGASRLTRKLMVIRSVNSGS